MSAILKDSVPLLPVGWQLTRLDALCDIQLGKMLSPAAKIGCSPLPYLRNQNVQWGRFDLVDVSRMDFDEDEQKKFLLRSGDLLVCEGGEPGRAAVWNGEIQPCFYQKALHRLRPKGSRIDPHFLMHRLRLSSIKGEFASSHGKTTIAHLPADRLAALQVALPSLAEQKRIAALLNNQIASAHQTIDEARTQKQALGDLVVALLRDSIAGGTQRLPLAECLTETKKGVGPSWNSFPVLGATRAGLALAKDPVGKQPERYKLVDEGTIFYNPMRILLGSIATVDSGDSPGITSPDYVVFRCNPDRLHHRWFYHWLRSPFGERFIKGLTRGAVRERLLFKRLAVAEIEVPSIEAQEKVADRLPVIRDALEKLDEQIELAGKLPSAYLRQAFAAKPESAFAQFR